MLQGVGGGGLSYRVGYLRTLPCQAQNRGRNQRVQPDLVGGEQQGQGCTQQGQP